MKVERIHTYIEEHRLQYVEVLKELTACPSVGTRPDEMETCAVLLSKKMTGMGIRTQVFQTKGNPVIFGEAAAGKHVPTILFYGHYDVQPAGDEHLWTSSPFEPEVRNGKIYGRGTADNKGQFLTHLLAAEAYLKNGGTPINLKFILDGEEEIGSYSLTEFAKQNKELLNADLVYTSDGSMEIYGNPDAIFGVRGVFNFDLTLTTASCDNHSGNKGGVIRNPAWEMVSLLSQMIDSEGRVLIPGFYDEVAPVTDEDRKAVDKMPFYPEEIAENFGVDALTAANKEQYYEKLMFMPTLTINGLISGYGGEGCKNIIPASATAKMEVRLVWKQNPQRLYDLIEQFVHQVNPDIKIEPVEAFMHPSKSQMNLPVMQSVLTAVRRIFDKEVTVLPISGGSLPDYIWTEIMDLPSVIIPYGNPDENNHAPDENLDLELFFKGIHTTAQVIAELAEGDTRYE